MATQSTTAPFPDCRFERERGVWSLIRPMERALSLLILLLLSPWLALVAITVAALSGRSPLVAHLRVGQFGAPLWTLKFRTMWPRRSQATGGGLIEYIIDERGPDDKRSADPRITSKFARFCRRFSVDELPQLIHLVAPRPLTVGELQKYYGSDASEILTVRPGITGLWQVSGRSQLTYEQRRELDLFLVRHRSLRLYFTILLRTIPAVLTGKDGW
jgi:lipopolysaccharide/colanic/teichoic acid biosynthesis glycosyltransferase